MLNITQSKDTLLLHCATGTKERALTSMIRDIEVAGIVLSNATSAGLVSMTSAVGADREERGAAQVIRTSATKRSSEEQSEVTGDGYRTGSLTTGP